MLRYLITGGCKACRVQGWGVNLAGAWIVGQLDLSFARARGATFLTNCLFEQRLIALQARFEALNLNGSALPGLNAQGARVSGGVFLRNGFAAEGEVSLSGATIGGQLSCVGGKFTGPRNEKGKVTGHALNAHSAQVTGGVFLSDGFAAEGEVSLSGATIGGQLSCVGGKFDNPGGTALNAQGARVTDGVFLRDGFAAEGEVSLSGATIGGQLVCDGGKFTGPRNGKGEVSGDALNGQRMRVKEGFFWRQVEVSEGAIDLTSAHVGDLVDDLASWPDGGRVILDGFTYDRISGASFTDSRRRLAWLARGTLWNGEFHPQPYAHLARVLREMGHDRGARDVRVEQGRLIRHHIRRRALDYARNANALPLRGVFTRGANLGRYVWDLIQRGAIGYGYKPYRSLIWFAGLWLAAVALADMAWLTGAMVPNSDVILTSDGWRAVAHHAQAAALWTASGAPGQDWETFSRLAWGFDVVVPILSLGQTDAWAPSTNRGGWGVAAWWGRWVLSVSGWVVVALAAAAVTGIIRRE